MRRAGLRTLAALATVLLVLTTTATPASASDDWGTTGDFNGFPYSSYGACSGDLTFYYLAYRLNSSTVTIEWRVNTSGQGVMQVRPYDLYGPAAPARTFQPIHSLAGSEVFYTHWTAGLPHTWHWGWHPPSGGVCVTTLYVS